MSMTNINSEIDRLQRELIDARVDLNIKDERIRQLERQLKQARTLVRDYEVGTMTMNKLRVLENKDEDDFDPRQSGTFDKDIWSKIR